MGIHDFDLARWFMGEVATVSAMAERWRIRSWRRSATSTTRSRPWCSRAAGWASIDLTRNGFYGYDISTELLGTAGTVRIGYIRETPILMMTKNSVAHDTVPYFMERFERAYTLQLQNFAQKSCPIAKPPVKVSDGVEALRVALAATEARRTGRSGAVASIK